MIRKLRRRFIIVNMSILTFVLFAVLTGIFIYMYSSEVRISNELMESILSEKDIGIKEPEKVSESADVVINTDTEAFSANVALMSFQTAEIEEYDSEDDYVFYNYPENFYYLYEDNENGWREPDNPFWRPEPTFEPFEPEIKPTEPVQVPENSGVVTDKVVPDVTEPNVQTSTQKPTDSATQPTQGNAPQGNTGPEPNENPQEPNFENENKPSGEIISTVTSVSSVTKTEITTIVTTTTLMHTEPEEKFPDPYRGNVKRAYILIMFNQEDDIDRMIYQYFDNIDESEVRAAAIEIANGTSNSGKLSIGDYKIRYMKEDNPRMMGGCRLVFLDRTLEISTINRMLFIFIIIASVGILFLFGISVLLANWTIKPVDKAWNQQKQFVADASHELKTPLTVILANTDVILSNENDTVKSQTKWLKYIKEEAKRMTKLVNSMLYVAKYDSNEIKIIEKQFNFSDIISSICLQFESLIYENGKLLETEIEDDLSLKGDEDKFKQLVNILLDNAQKYSTEKGKIKVKLSRDIKSGKTLFTVSNTSEFIAEEKLEKLFDRFYRLDDSRNRKTGGSGLGLNIAKSIVELHGGNINATHNNGITSFNVVI